MSGGQSAFYERESPVRHCVQRTVHQRATLTRIDAATGIRLLPFPHYRLKHHPICRVSPFHQHIGALKLYFKHSILTTLHIYRIEL